jgi:hypothetical protein
MLDIITPSGDRPLQFSLCKEWMKNQTFTGPVHWIVVDDSIYGNYDISGLPDNWEVTHLTPKIDKTPAYSTQGQNLFLALDKIKYTKIVMVEDDDYYSPIWLDLCSQHLDDYGMFGIKNLVNYNLNNRTWLYKQYAGRNNNPMCTTSLRAGLVPALKKICAVNEDMFDHLLWEQKDTFYLKEFILPPVIGVKGLPGRRGMTTKHRRILPNNDASLNTFKEFVGQEAFLLYKEKFNDLFK